MGREGGGVGTYCALCLQGIGRNEPLLPLGLIGASSPACGSNNTVLSVIMLFYSQLRPPSTISDGMILTLCLLGIGGGGAPSVTKSM